MASKHNKKKNALLVYEFLVKTISRAIVEGDEKRSGVALKVLKRNFRPGSELYREFRIMRAIARTTVNTERAASTILTEARKAIDALDWSALDREKSRLVSQINRAINDPDFYDQEVSGYRDYAAIQTLVNEWRSSDPDISTMGRHEDDVVKALMTEKMERDVEVDDEGIGTTRLVMKVMTRKLNEKYGATLTESQRAIVRAYAYSTATSTDDTLRMKLEGVRSDLTAEIDRTLSGEVPGGEYVSRKLVEVRSLVSGDAGSLDDDDVMRHMTYAKLLSELRTPDVTLLGESTDPRLPPPAFTDPHLLTSYDVFDYTPDQVRESKERNEGRVVLKGILQKADTLNQNGRIYPLSVLEREVRNYQKFISEARALGEIDHPDSSVVSLKNASHLVREAYIQDGVVYGTVEILHRTPSGAILVGLVESGVKLGISSRGVGSTKTKDGYQVVSDDFQLICWDFVSEPSTPGAFMIPEGRKLDGSRLAEELRTVFNKSDRIDRILNEVLTTRSA